MSNYRQPLLTILVIFATAYVLTILGCAKSADNKQNGAVQQPPVDAIEAKEKDIKPVDEKSMRECTASEFTTLQTWSTALKASDEAIKSRSSHSASLALVALKQCNAVQSYHSTSPCKKTRPKSVVEPKVIVTIGAYDASRINERCKVTRAFAKTNKLQPSPAQPAPTPTPTPSQPVPKPPVVGGTEPISGLRQCSLDEFNKIKMWRTSLDLATKNISKLGSDLKYEPIAIDAAITATKNCEALIAYHQSKPCAKEKEYTSESIREQCKPARSYFYDFAQRMDSLITPNANLYFDTSVVANKTFRTGFGENSTYGNCLISNTSSQNITYTDAETLVKEARIYTGTEESAKNMFVFVTQEGLKFECYGLDYKSLKTSKTEVVRLMSEKQTQIPLRYELN
jgi:hypothetical protein